MGRTQLIVGTLFCLAASLLGTAFLYLFVRPTVQVIDACDWPEVPCVIVSSCVVRNMGGENSHYSVKVSYEYEVEGKRYQSSRYGFFPFGVRGLRRAREIVHRVPAGKKTVCYVRPGDPSKAVINRGLSGGLWWGLIPVLVLLFVSPGVYGLVVRIYLWLMGRPCEDLDVTKFQGEELGREMNRHLLWALVGCCLVVIGILVVLFVIAWWDVHY